ncbi:MAG: PAS domain S-box protein [Verrucomicrobiota bacterium]
MLNDPTTEGKWTERSSVVQPGMMDNESMFRLLFERSADAMTLLDPVTSAFFDANEAAVRMTDAPSKAALLGSSPSRISPERQPDGSPSEDKVKEVIQLAIEHGSHRFEWVINRFDGSHLPVEIVLTLIRGGKQPLLLSVSRDITERKRTENELRENQQLLVSVADNISEAIYRTGPNHDLIFANRAYLQMSGYTSLEEMRHVPRETLYAHPEGRARLLDLLARNGSFRNEEIEYIRRDGRHWWGLTNSIAVRDERTGKVLYHVGSVADITERKHAEDEIRKLNASLEQRIAERTAELTASEARLRTIVDHAPEAIVVFDGDTARFLSSNVHAQELYGCTAEELKRLGPAEVSPEFQPDGRSSAEAARDWINQALAGKTPIFEWLHQHSSGRIVPTEVRLVRLPAEGKNLLRASIIDNTEHKRIEEALRQRGEQMQKHRDVLLRLARADKSDFNRALRLVTSQAASTLEVTRVSYWSLRENDTALVCELLLSNPGEQVMESFAGTRLSAGAAPAYFAALAFKRPIAAGDVLTHAATLGLVESYLRPLGITSLLDVPVWVRGEVVGVICHEHTGPAREWSAEEIDFASSLAAMVSLALEESQRAKSERLLRESEEKFRALFEASSQGIMLHDEQQYLQVNPAVVKILGYDSPEELIGLHPSMTSPPIQPNGKNTAVLAQKYIQECLSRGHVRFDWVARRKTGEHVPVEVILTRIQWGGKQIIQAAVNDISQRKRAEDELRASAARLRESEARFSAAFHSSPLTITIARLSDGIFVEANETFLRWAGCTRDEVVGQSSQGFGLWLDLEDREQFWSAMRDQKVVRDFECQLRTRDGKVYTMLLSADIIEIHGEPHVMIVGHDITDRKSAEAELLKTLAREKELGQLKSNFVSMVSHEFRTPLGVIMSSAEILENYLQQLEPEDRREQLQSIQKNTRRMADLMEEVLVLGMVEAGKLDFKPASLDFAALCRRLVDEVQSATGNKCSVQISTPGDVKAAFADERLLQHVFINLLANAVKYSPAGSTVHFDVERDGDAAACRIRDHGMGIPEADLERLFSAFHRGRNATHVPGTGLGLTIVKRCVELHRGKIKVESTVGRGTTVTVRLPLFADNSEDSK